MTFRWLVLGAVIAVPALGCGKSSLTSADAGVDRFRDRPLLDAARDVGHDAAADTRHTHDAAADVRQDAANERILDAGRDRSSDSSALKGRRAFDVTIKLTLQPTAAPSTGFPTTATATLILDATEGWVVLGGLGQGARAPIIADGTTITVTQPLALGVPSSGTCTGTTVAFDALKLTVGDDGKLQGTGSGQESYITGDVGYSTRFTAILDGVPDTTPPAVPVATGGAFDPLAPARFAASEPLPAGAQAQLVGADGTIVNLTPQMAQDGSPPFATAFLVPTVLPFGGSFHLVLGPVVDFAGNRASSNPAAVLSTLAPPPLLSDGSFESTPVATANGGVFAAGGDLPVISGTRSFYIVDPTPFSGQAVTFRLAVHPGDKAVRFAYRVVAMYQVAGGGFYGSVVVGSVGSKIASLSFLPMGTPTTTVTRSTGGTSTVGSVATAELALPDPGATEVVLKIATASGGCGLPPPQAGLIIDDVRVGS